MASKQIAGYSVKAAADITAGAIMASLRKFGPLSQASMQDAQDVMSEITYVGQTDERTARTVAYLYLSSMDDDYGMWKTLKSAVSRQLKDARS